MTTDRLYTLDYVIRYSMQFLHTYVLRTSVSPSNWKLFVHSFNLALHIDVYFTTHFAYMYTTDHFSGKFVFELVFKTSKGKIRRIEFHSVRIYRGKWSRLFPLRVSRVIFRLQTSGIRNTPTTKLSVFNCFVDKWQFIPSTRVELNAVDIWSGKV